MKTRNQISALLGILFITIFSFQAGDLRAEKAPKSTQNIVEIAVSNNDFSILVEALKKADLVDALMADGPYTVFAPTNEAFNKLFKDLNISGINDLSADQLKPILLYHVVNAKVMSSDVKSGEVNTLNSDAMLKVGVKNNKVVLNESSKVVKTDIQGSNGVIHVIDRVLVPTQKTSKKSMNSGGGC